MEKGHRFENWTSVT